jgi:hypothetical protein
VLSIFRLIVGYELFEVSEVFQLKSNLSQAEAMISINKYIDIGLYANIVYSISFFFITALVIVFKGNMKKKGWAFMSIVLFLLFLPSEVYLILNDVDMYYYINSFIEMTSDKYDGVVHIFKMRFLSDIFKTLVPMSILTHIAIVLFLIFKPLNKNES